MKVVFFQQDRKDTNVGMVIIPGSKDLAVGVITNQNNILSAVGDFAINLLQEKRNSLLDHDGNPIDPIVDSERWLKFIAWYNLKTAWIGDDDAVPEAPSTDLWSVVWRTNTRPAADLSETELQEFRNIQEVITASTEQLKEIEHEIALLRREGVEALSVQQEEKADEIQSLLETRSLLMRERQKLRRRMFWLRGHRDQELTDVLYGTD